MGGILRGLLLALVLLYCGGTASSSLHNNNEHDDHDGATEIPCDPMQRCRCKRNNDTADLTLVSCQNADLICRILNGDPPIKYIEPNAFQHCSKVNRIEMMNNEIQGFPSDLFANCSNLANLLLRSNSIRKLPQNLFGSCQNLQKLDLDSNELETIPWTVFDSCNKLKDLSLIRNEINCIRKETFGSLPKNADIYVCGGNPGCSPKSCQNCTYDSFFGPIRPNSNQGFCIYSLISFSLSSADYVAISVIALALVGIGFLIAYRWKLCRQRIVQLRLYKSDRAHDRSAKESESEDQEPSYSLEYDEREVALHDSSRQQEGMGALELDQHSDDMPRKRPRSDSKAEIIAEKVGRFDQFTIKGNAYREQKFRELKASNYWPWENFWIWGLFGPLEVGLFIGFILYLLILRAIYLKTLGSSGDDDMITADQASIYWSFPVYMMFLAVIGYRIGYFGTKYISFAMELFHGCSMDGMVLGMERKEFESSGEDCTDSGVPDTGHSPSKTSHLERDSQGPTKPSNRCKELYKRCAVMVAAFMVYFPEFLQALQICRPVMAPYTRGQANRGESTDRHGTFAILKISNLEIFDKNYISNIDDRTKFDIFLFATISMISGFAFVVFLALCFGEPWIVDTLKLVRQTLSVAEYETSHFRRCHTPVSCILAWFWRWSGKLLDCITRCFAKNRNLAPRPWLKKCFLLAKKCLDLTFIPCTLHLAGLFINPNMYPSVFGPSLDWRLPTALVTIIFWYLINTVTYSFNGIVFAIQDKEKKTQADNAELVLHPRFLYKMIWARLGMIVFTSFVGVRMENGVYTTTSLAPSNFHVRVFSVVILWWLVFSHTESMGLIRNILCSYCTCCRHHRQESPVASASTNSPLLENNATGVHCDNTSDTGQTKRKMLSYPSRIKWFNLRHRAALAFVALFSTLILVEYYAHMYSTTLMLWAGAIFCVTVIVTESLKIYLAL